MACRIMAMKTPPAARPSLLSVGSWVLYDLANTIFSLSIVSLSFSIWIVNVMGVRDAVYGLANSLSMAVVFVAAPFLGALTDQVRRRMPFLVAATLACVSFTFFLGFAGTAGALILFGLANIAYQSGLQFYDALLPDVSTPADRGRIGGIGVAVGYFGSFIGIAAAMLILRGVDGMTPERQTGRYSLLFQATAVLFLVFALPCFLFVRERARSAAALSLGSAARAFRQVKETLGSAGKFPGLLRFLIGRVFYTDAVNTVIAFMGIYVTNEAGFGQHEVYSVMAVAIAFAVAGGITGGWLADRVGPKRALDLALFLWMACLAWTATVGFLDLPRAVFWPVPVMAGFALGGTWAADRPYMLLLTPPRRIGEFYGLYGMVGRFSFVVGPLVWGLVTDGLGLGRPAAIVTMLAAVVVSYFILRPIREPRP